MNKFKYCTVVKVKHVLPRRINGYTNYISCMVWHKPRREITNEVLKAMLKEQYYMLTDDEVEKIKIVSWDCCDGYEHLE